MILRICAQLLVFSAVARMSSAQSLGKAIVNMCDPADRNSCGQFGWCERRHTGNRCHCQSGRMGIKCSRPCQDVFKSCKRWVEEDRCYWARNTTSFFMDNCSKSCGECTSDGRILELALPPMLEPLAWLIGRWEARTSSGQRYPQLMSSAYHEVLDISISEVPAFDRPGINITVLAETRDGHQRHTEFGFMTGKPFNEDTGFMRIDDGRVGDDLVAIEMVSDTGAITIEEGVVRGQSIALETVYKKSIFGASEIFLSSKRRFSLLAPGWLEERTIFKDKHGRERKWIKRFRLVHDYLTDIVQEKF